MNRQCSLATLLAFFVSPLSLAATIATLDQGPVAGHPSLAIGADGLPVIAYDDGADGLRVTHCLDIDCSMSSSVLIPDPPTGGTWGRYNSITVAPDGNPAIAFYDPYDNQVKLVKCSTIDCTGSHVFRTISTGQGSFADIAIAWDPAGNAMFVFRDVLGGNLLLSRCLNAGCGNVDTEVLLPFAGNVVHGYDAAIAVADTGAPVISGRSVDINTRDATLDFVRCRGAPCAGAPQSVFETIGESVDHLSMVLRANQRPVFAFHGISTSRLMFGGCQNSDCSGLQHYRTIDEGPFGAGTYTAITVRSDGRPVIAYQKAFSVIAGEGQALHVAECDDEDCLSSDRFVIDQQPGANTGVDPAIAIGTDGGMLIAYFAQSAFAMRIAKCNPQSCRGPGDRLFSGGFD